MQSLKLLDLFHEAAPGMRKFARFSAFLLSVGFLSAGCESTNPLTNAVVGGGTKYASGLSEPELRDKLGEFYGHFVGTIEAAALYAANQTQDANLRTRLTLTKLRTTRTCRDVVFQQQPMMAFVDTWALCIHAHR